MEFRLPELGEGVYEAELSEWLVAPGDKVKNGQDLLEVITDKASMKVPAPFTGVIETLEVESGDLLKIGQLILNYAGAGEAKSQKAKTTKKSSPKSTKTKSNLKQQVTDKHANGKQVANPPASATTTISGRRFETPRTLVASSPALAIQAAPSVRRLARNLDIDLETVQGTGPGGRILLDDLTHLIQQRDQTAARTKPTRKSFGKPGEIIPLKGLRKTIAKRMQEANRNIPHVTLLEECEVTRMVELRDELKEAFQAESLKLTYLAFFVKAVCAALKDVPILNSSFDEEAQTLQLHDQYHIGIATATDQGLLVPVIRDADKKEFTTIVREIQEQSIAARAGTLKREQLTGSTFTITSLGNLGGLFSTPILNESNAGILGIGKIIKRPVYDEHDQLRPAQMVTLSLSFDHRILDGDAAATFFNQFISHLERPTLLILNRLA